MAEDPLCEVGCPYAVRGFDYDYVGVLWLNDLLWRDDHWEINAATVHERGMANLARQARREKSQTGRATQQVLDRTLRAYRILLTRALKGSYIWIADTETKRYVKGSTN
ncbi:MAG: DNA/RNA helicase domain-containing protein [Chthoniobacterales bacterium]